MNAHACENCIEARDVRLSRSANPVLKGLSVKIPPRSFTAIVGPNGCGKSTLLMTLSRILAPDSGNVLIDGRAAASLSAREFARRVGLMPQSSIAPDGITVAELVACGRFPYQSALRQWSREDERAVTQALAATGLSGFATRHVNELSGGQRQRAWVALVLAQETPVLFLDEPTSFLDITHQIELMTLLETLNMERGHTVAAVLHDLNQACRFATHMIAMRDGQIIAEGPPAQIVTEELVARVFQLQARIIPDPVSGTPLVIPRGGSRDTSPTERGF
ncbi:ABC transporter ATP-binding protein [Aureimonas populi]|uniref:ABC transporter ATP-binding protein n=1 Tax=Aureimonas populi TaxID=1701758 RepID=A0ABW5CMI4_9HYPH|nr:ABC transporter ATP-binding protein [Aureimonas populi]